MSTGPSLIKEFTNLSLSAMSDTQALTLIHDVGQAAGLIKPSWLEAALTREASSPTGLPTSIPVAIPHTDAEHCYQNGIGFFKLTKPVEFGEMGSLDRKVSVQLIIPLLITEPKAQLPLLMSVINLVQDQNKLAELNKLSTEAEISTFFSQHLVPSI